MNKAHRDRIAFMRICSGKFERGMEVFHVQGGKKLQLAQPQHADGRTSAQIVDEAYAGDIIGVFDPGIFSIGDTICDGRSSTCSSPASPRSRRSISARHHASGHA